VSVSGSTHSFGLMFIKFLGRYGTRNYVLWIQIRNFSSSLNLDRRSR